MVLDRAHRPAALGRAPSEALVSDSKQALDLQGLVQLLAALEVSQSVLFHWKERNISSSSFSPASQFGSGAATGAGTFGSAPASTFGTPGLSSPFGQTQQQPGLGLGGSFGTPGGLSTGSFGASTFGKPATSTSPFGATQTPSFGATQTAFGAQPGFGAAAQPAFGAPQQSTGMFGGGATQGLGTTGYFFSFPTPKWFFKK